MFTKKKSLGQAIKEWFGLGSALTDDRIDDLEDLLLESDLGPKVAMELSATIRNLAKDHRISAMADIQEALAKSMEGQLKAANIAPTGPGLHCYLFLGVNGVGKTTSLAKFAHWLKTKRHETSVVLAAGDTFRAAACAQLELHGQRLGLRTVSQGQGADSAAVVYDALSSAQARGERVVLADTAGRLHNKAHLVKELEKVDKVVRGRLEASPGGVYKKILVLDAGTGANGIEQARVFHEAVGVDGVILTKYDSEARGGMIYTLCRDLGLGVAWLGTGESYDDFQAFVPSVFARRLVGLSGDS